MERQHGTILKSANGAALDDHVLCVTCFGCGAFGSQFSVGNTTFGRFTTILRNSLNLDRSSGIRLFVKRGNRWSQLGFPSVFVMERDRVRWIYKTDNATFEVIARSTSDTIEYSMIPVSGKLPKVRVSMEVCGTANEFDAAPLVEWDRKNKLITILPSDGSLLKNKYPESCLLARLDAVNCTVGGAELFNGGSEPYVVIDVPHGKFSLELTGHYEGRAAAMERFCQPDAPDWNALMANFDLKSDGDSTKKLSDTLKWYAHNAMIHFAAPRGMEQYGGAAWGTRDVCQGPLEFLLALGHDQVAASMLCKTFTHQYSDTGTWPQWFMFDGFGEIQQHESHGDIVYWPIKALCDYIEQTGDFLLLEKQLAFTDSESFELTTETSTLNDHVKKAVAHIIDSCVDDTALPSYGDGDWNDSLQPANQAMKTHMVSGWTVGLAYQSLSTLQKVWKTAGCARESEELKGFLGRMYDDFQKHILKDGVAAGFVLFEGGRPNTCCTRQMTKTAFAIVYYPLTAQSLANCSHPRKRIFTLDWSNAILNFPTAYG